MPLCFFFLKSRLILYYFLSQSPLLSPSIDLLLFLLLQAYFAALGELHRLTTAEGQKLYGEEFRGVDEMNKQHMTFPDFTEGCTSMHNYMSFLSGHTSMWRQTENQLQIINPKIAAPYWDLTIDALRVDVSHCVLIFDLT